jgi:Transposase IS116/IS110/IS902 family
MRGASFLVAVTFAAEIGDVRRFETPRQLMSFLGLVPAESSTGDTVKRKGLTLRAIDALAGPWLKPLGHIVIPPGSAKHCEPASKACRSRCAISLGKHSFGCAPGIVGSALPARSCLWRSPPLLARWQLFCGPSVVRSPQCSGPFFLAAQRRGWGHGGELTSLVSRRGNFLAV